MDALAVAAGLPDGDPFVGVARGSRIESVHRVAACAVGPDERILLAMGTIDVPVYLRSTAKPFIAAAAVREGVVERFGFEAREIATMSASHDGEPFHVDAVYSMLGKIGLPETALLCGPHAPYDAESAQALVRTGTPFTAVHNNCSGKHAGILALAVLLGADPAGYLEPEHPAQQKILALCARVCDDTLTPDRIAVDGCGIPVFATPLRNAALAFSRFATLQGVDERDARAMRTVRDAMTAFPQYVSGTNEFDTLLMAAGAGRIAAKSGAEGVHGLADIQTGIGLALKVVDGAGRATPPAAMALIRQLGLLDAGALAGLQRFERPPLLNRAGRRVGEIHALPRPGVSYDVLERQVQALLRDEGDLLANAANFAALVYGELPDVNWAGFYRLETNGDLILGPFAGKPACTRLPEGRGVCGAALRENAAVVVDDVSAFADHIVCDSASRSELAVPVYDGGKAVGVFDVDSPLPSRFSEADRRGLERLVRAFERGASPPAS